MSDPNKIHKLVTLGCIAVIGFFLSFAIIAYTPLSNLIPGYPTAEVRNQQVRTAILIDSLERSIQRWEMYTENVRRVAYGQKPVQIDSLIRRFDRSSDEEDASSLAKSDSILRATVAEAEKFEVSDHNKRILEIEGLHFFKPINGYVLEAYSPSIHPYVLVTAKEGSQVNAVMDGNVIFTTWSEKDLWTIVVQHASGIVSIYRNNQTILKRAADHVSAGTAIAILGGSEANHTASPALHFELWQNGSPLDPASYINF